MAGGSRAAGGGAGTAAAKAARRLATAGVEMVALAMVDNAGVTLVKCVPLHRFEEAVRFGIGLSPVFSVFLVDDSITSSPDLGGPAGDTRLMPDPAATMPLAASPGWAIALYAGPGCAGCGSSCDPPVVRWPRKNSIS